MEFKFNINDYFKQQIVAINHNLIPPGFSGDRRQLWDSVSKVTEIVNALGESSAAAQGLTKAITTADRLRNSEHKLFLLIDPDHNNGKGAISGMLKVGKKTLYLFDREGNHFQVTPLCILDFYVHESRQRLGLGKILYENMLEEEQIEPVKIAIDRPSDKFLGFLRKHYHLNSPIKQMNNYVVFDGFFPEEDTKSERSDSLLAQRSSPSVPTHSSFSQYGRYGAPRPKCSMGQIIHNDTSTVPSSPATPVGSFKSIENLRATPSPKPIEKKPDSPKLERPQSLRIQMSEDGDSIEIVNDADVPDHQNGHVAHDELVEQVRQVDLEAEPAQKKTPSHLTEQGFFDLKFYHNKLW
ncbi:unnamed protein product [Brassicogethes aeneus]|uniref:Alpha-tubulin N-acetyltransferase n=1 Tax=Brassicogethes aeneus TaxID=1431903 RepID=A0A9P0FBX5_BRAAE|nr:unnamed protein product [Brassicogethes aeneus]